MICPMTFSNPETFHHGAMECDLDCAWAFLLDDKLVMRSGCAHGRGGRRELSAS